MGASSSERGPGWHKTPIDELPWPVLIRVALCRGAVVLILTLLVAAFLPRLFGMSGTTIVTGSMRPSIQPGDVALTWPLPVEDYEVGQVILFEDPADPSRQIMHRIVDVTDDGAFITKGDANADRDSTPVPPELVIGIGRILVTGIGLPIVWAANGDILLVIATVIALCLLLRGCLAIEHFPSIRKSPLGLLAAEVVTVIGAVGITAILVSVGLTRSSYAVFTAGTDSGGSTWATKTVSSPCEISEWYYTYFPPNATVQFRTVNHTPADIPGDWSLAFTFVDDQQVLSSTNGTTFQFGQNVTFRSDAWTTIPPDGFIDAQLTVTSTTQSYLPPVGFTLNGMPCAFTAPERVAPPTVAEPPPPVIPDAPDPAAPTVTPSPLTSPERSPSPSP